VTDLQRLDAALGPTLQRLGIAPVEILLGLEREWDDLAGELWRGRSKPVVLRGGVLFVEVEPPTVVRLLEYATGELLQRIDARFGEAVVGSVRVVARRER